MQLCLQKGLETLDCVASSQLVVNNVTDKWSHALKVCWNCSISLKLGTHSIHAGFTPTNMVMNLKIRNQYEIIANDISQLTPVTTSSLLDSSIENCMCSTSSCSSVRGLETKNHGCPLVTASKMVCSKDIYFELALLSASAVECFWAGDPWSWSFCSHFETWRKTYLEV